ncbi:hypothetical protein Aduo_009046 [Ancylostoma duodenale]
MDPVPIVTKGRSPAENFIGRQTRMALTMLNTLRRNPEERNRRMEETAEDTEQKLLDLFDLPTECQRHPTKAVSIPMPTPATTLTRPTESDGNDPSTATSTSRPLRRSTRQRRAPIPLNMDPSRKTYLQM